MTCEKMKNYMPDMLLDPAQVSADARMHVDQCENCAAELRELQSTMQMLDAWQAPEPSPYFATRLAVRLREEKQTASIGWLERMRMRLLYGNDLHLRPLAAGAFALFLVVGGGTYAGFVSLNQTAPRPHVSATVHDLELLDSNAQTLQQLAAFDDGSNDIGAGTSTETSN